MDATSRGRPARSAHGRARVRRRRQLDPVGLCPVLERVRSRHRRAGRAHGRRAWAGARPRQPRAARPEGPPRLAGERGGRSTHRSAGPRGRAAVRATWDEAMQLVVERSQQVLADHGPLGLGFYTSGQLFLEDYYTLAVIARAGIGTPHLDGNTRLCTATSDAALKETFGSDGAPGFADRLRLVRHHLRRRPQHGRDPHRAVGAGVRPVVRTGPTSADHRRPAADAGRPGSGRPPGHSPRHERGPAERHPARAHRQRLGG